MNGLKEGKLKMLKNLEYQRHGFFLEGNPLYYGCSSLNQLEKFRIELTGFNNVAIFGIS